MDQDETWDAGRPSPGHIVLDGDTAPLPQRGREPSHFLAHICCSQMAAWIKMPLGMEIGLYPGDFGLDGDPAPLPKRGRSLKFRPVFCGQTAGWIKMVLGTEVGLSPGDFVLDGDPTPTSQKGGGPFVVAKRLDGSRWHLAWK